VQGLEEKKAWALIDAGYDGGFNVVGGAYDSVGYQNANHSVRVTDDFMQAVCATASGRPAPSSTAAPSRPSAPRTSCTRWPRRRGLRRPRHPVRHHGQRLAPVHQHRADQRLEPVLRVHVPRRLGVQPGVAQPAQVPATPAASSTSLVPQGLRDTITAMEIIVDNSKYPTEKIAQNSWDYRPLGLGFANLGALLMSRGLPYDSAPGRAYAGAITAIMCGEAYRQSAQIAADATGPFVGYAKNEQPMMRVMRKHRQAVEKIDSAFVPYDLMSGARQVWDEAIATGEKYGFRNGQVTVLAPTGTIAFLMDCDTTGVEPDIALVKYKRLVGGGLLKTTNQTVPEALTKLGYDDKESPRSSRTSPPTTPSRARPASRTSTCRSSTARSARATAPARSTTWATCG
jgi:ribonucleoside-diphosphate reductase alpha chain